MTKKLLSRQKECPMRLHVCSKPRFFRRGALWFALLITMIAMIGSPAVGQTTAIVGATVIDGNDGPPVVNATILVEGKRIVAVGPRPSISIPRGAQIIDGAGKFVTPGFIDVNVHVTGGNLSEELFPLLLYG